jgi:hypothetical protein
MPVTGGIAAPRNVGEAMERLAFVNEGLRAIRQASASPALRAACDRLVEEVNAIRIGLPAIAAAGGQKQKMRRRGGTNRDRSPGWQRKNRINPETHIEERFCPRHHAGQGAWVPTEHFDVKDPVNGTLRYCCRDCWREYQRERYVAANKRAIIIEVIEGDQIIGAHCNACGRPFDIGDLVVGALPRHQECCLSEVVAGKPANGNRRAGTGNVTGCYGR